MYQVRNGNVLIRARCSQFRPSIYKQAVSRSATIPAHVQLPWCLEGVLRQSSHSLLGYVNPPSGANSSLIVLGLVKRLRMSELPALSFVPLALAPPNVC